MDANRPEAELLADPPQQGPVEPTPTATVPDVSPAAPAGHDERLGRYDANVQLILRRLADNQRTDKKPRRWWQGR